MMFCRRKQSESIPPKKIGKLDRDELYAKFSKDEWETLTVESRLLLLQEVENRRAQIDGRKPIRVVIAEDQEFLDEPGLMGCFDPQGQVIKVNHRFLKLNSPIHSGARALGTILHEGRHAYQTFIMREKPEKLPESVLLEWFSSHAKYFSGIDDGPEGKKLRLLYAFQSIEIDARRFARNELIESIQSMQARGIPCDEHIRQLSYNLIEEDFMNQQLRKLITLEDIDRFERMVIKEMGTIIPERYLDGFKPFREARGILEQPNIDRLEDRLQLILQRDAFETQQLNAIQNDREIDKSGVRMDRRVGMIQLRKG